MINDDLIEGVAAELRDALKEVRLPLEHNSAKELKLKPVNLFVQLLPRELFNDETYFPYVSVEFLSMNDELNPAKSVSTLGLTCGVFAAEVNRWKDALHLLEVVRYRLLTRRVIAKKFRLVDGINFQVVDDQPLPFFLVCGTVTYSTFLPSSL